MWQAVTADAGLWGWGGWGAIEAIAVSIAVISASMAAYFQYRADQELREEVTGQEDDKRRKQASQVVLVPWQDHSTNPELGARLPRPQQAASPTNADGISWRYLRLANGSDAPITDVSIVWLNDGAIAEWEIARAYVITAGQEETYKTTPNPGRTTDDFAAIRLRFTDMNGRRWERNALGSLDPLGSPQA